MEGVGRRAAPARAPRAGVQQVVKCWGSARGPYGLYQNGASGHDGAEEVDQGQALLAAWRPARGAAGAAAPTYVQVPIYSQESALGQMDCSSGSAV